jgi:hypothetical protein
MIDVASYLPHDKRDIDVPVNNAVAEEKTFEAGFNVMSQRLKDPWNKILKKQLNSKLIQYVRRVKTRDEANEFFLFPIELLQVLKELVRLILRFHPSDIFNHFLFCCFFSILFHGSFSLCDIDVKIVEI